MNDLQSAQFTFAVLAAALFTSFIYDLLPHSPAAALAAIVIGLVVALAVYATSRRKP